jgi:methylthioribose-1-phosphate isomerase
MNTPVYPVRWQSDRVLLIDQNRLPNEYTYVEISRVADMAQAISTMIVRGAPAIGVAAAYGMYLGARDISTRDRDEFLTQLVAIGKTLRATRPTAVNLFWAIDRMEQTARNCEGTVGEIIPQLLIAAQQMV